MNRFLSVLVSLTTATALAAEEPKPGTDLYGDPLPPGAVLRMGTIRLRHADADVAFSKDGKQLISCGTDGTVRVWDVADGKLLRRTRLAWKPQQDELLQKLILSADGGLAATPRDKSVCLYETKTGKKIGQMSIGKLAVAPTFSPTGQVLALQYDQRLELWSTHEFNRVQSLAALATCGIAFTRDAKRLAGVGTDHNLRVWNTANGAEIIVRNDGIEPEESALAFSPDGKVLAVGSKSDRAVRLLNASTLRPEAQLRIPADLKAESIESLTFSPNGLLLAGILRESLGPKLLLWSLGGSKKPPVIQGWLHDKFAFAPDGKTLAGYERQGSELGLWDVASGRPLRVGRGHTNAVRILSASADGKSIVSGDTGRPLWLWDADCGIARHALRSDEVYFASACLFAPDGKHVFAGGGSGTVRMWSVADGKERLRFRVMESDNRFILFHSAALSADGKRLAAVTSRSAQADTAELFVWDLAAGKAWKQRPYRGRKRFRPMSCMPWIERFDHAAFAPDGERATVWLGDRVGVEEVATGNLLATLPKGVSHSIRFAPDGRLLAAPVGPPKLPPNGVERLVFIETVSGEEIFHLDLETFDRVAFTPDSRAAIVADKKKLRVWDTDTGEKLYEMAWPECLRDGRGETEICSLEALSGGRIATGMAEGDILVWDLSSSTWPAGNRGHVIGRKELDALWSDLANDAGKAHRAMKILAVAPDRTVPFLEDRLRPMREVDGKHLEKLLADLDSDSFEIREASSRALTELRYRIETKLLRALEDKPTLEMRRRIQAILAKPKRLSAEALRMLRAIAVLDRIGTPEARRILEKLAGGADAPETRAAKAALVRWNKQ